jgi:hypothetical protein
VGRNLIPGEKVGPKARGVEINWFEVYINTNVTLQIIIPIGQKLVFHVKLVNTKLTFLIVYSEVAMDITDMKTMAEA